MSRSIKIKKNHDDDTNYVNHNVNTFLQNFGYNNNDKK